MKLTDDEIAAVISFEITQARGYDADVLANKRELALNYYYGIMAAPSTGRSAIVSTDVADALHATMAQIQPIVKTTLLEFEPDAEHDEPMAQAESDFVRKVIEREGGYETVFSVMHDALLIANGWLNIDTGEETKIDERSYPGPVTDEMLWMVSQPSREGEEVTVSSDDMGVTVTREYTIKRLRFECVPPEDMLFADRTGSSSLNDLRFVCQRKLMTVSELRDMGYSQLIVDQLPDATSDYWPGIVAREGIYRNDLDNESAQMAEHLKEVYCGYIRLDQTGNGKTELRYFWQGGAQLLKNEAATHISYITGSAIPMPHRVEGSGLYELLGDVQDGKTMILRNYIDNLDVMNASRVGVVDGQVNMKDLTNGRINGVVRCKQPGAVWPMPAADIGPQAMAGLAYLDQVRTSRVGSSLDLNELQGQIMQSSATAAAGTLANVERMAGWYANNLVETLLKPAFLLVHRLLREEMAGPIMAKIRGKWMETDTGQWPERKVLGVTMGMTTAERTQRLQALTATLGYQQQILQGGGAGVLTDNAKIYNALTDWCRASDLQTPQEYYIDPRSEEAQQAQQQQAQAAEQQSKAQQQAVVQTQAEIISLQGKIDLEKQQNDLRYKVWADKLDAEVKEAQITGNGIIEIAKLRASRKEEANEDQ